jgi:hypothetical protein
MLKTEVWAIFYWRVLVKFGEAKLAFKYYAVCVAVAYWFKLKSDVLSTFPNPTIRYSLMPLTL